MNIKDFNKSVEKQFSQCKKILDMKSSYNDKEDYFSYFRRAGALQGRSDKEALFAMLSKHLISVSDLCSSQEDITKDVWSEKITDSINYLLLLSAMVEDTYNE